MESNRDVNYEAILTPACNILLIEDNQSQSKLLKRWIEVTGNFNVTIVENGQAGLKSIQDGNWDLVISDIHVPGINGLELTRHIKTEQLPVPILLISAHDGLDANSQALRNQADDYLVKPFAKNIFVSKIENLLSRTRMEG
ncbi:MAG: response regulator [Acidobacteria bacterium]|nr:response regulator [Acidobacteriota bacterium]